jgi:hypothetical protein
VSSLPLAGEAFVTSTRRSYFTASNGWLTAVCSKFLSIVDRFCQGVTKYRSCAAEGEIIWSIFFLVDDDIIESPNRWQT